MVGRIAAQPEQTSTVTPSTVTTCTQVMPLPYSAQELSHDGKQRSDPLSAATQYVPFQHWESVEQDCVHQTPEQFAEVH